MLAELDGGEIWVQASFAENSLVRQVPGMRFHKGKDMWHVPATWAACLTMRAVYGPALKLGPKLIEWGQQQAKREENLHRVGTAMSLPGAVDIYDPRLFGYQKAGAEFLADAGRAILADEPGLGKTAQSISALKGMHERGINVFPILIVCPNSLKKNWEKEFAIWWPDEDLHVVVTDGPIAARRKQVMETNPSCPSHGKKNGVSTRGTGRTGSVKTAGTQKNINDRKHDQTGTAPTSGSSADSSGTKQHRNGTTKPLNYRVESAEYAEQTNHSTLTTTTSAALEQSPVDDAIADWSASNATHDLEHLITTNGAPTPTCTCNVIVTIVNWESVRNLSRTAGYGSIRLRACSACGGIDNPRPDEDYKAAVPEAKCERHPRELNKKGYRTVIVDEAHRGKTPDAKQTRAVWAVLEGATYRFMLTGTPIEDNVGDMWSLLHGLDPEAFPVNSKFLDTFATTRLNFFGGFEVLGLNPQRADVFRRILSSYMRRVPKALALPELPEKMPPQYRYVKLKPQQAKQYKQMKEGMLTLLDDDTPLTADSAVTQFARLRQFASATGSYDKETGTVSLSEPSSKIDDLVELLHDEQRPMVVAAESLKLINLAGKRLEAEKFKVGYITGDQSIDERDVAVRDFQEGKLDVVLVNGAGAEGITLTRADTLVFLERFSSNTRNKQMEDRIHRIGAEGHESIRIIIILAEGTIETNREYNLWEKTERAEEIIQDKARLKRMLT